MRGTDGVDKLAADIDRHQAEGLLTIRPSNAAAHQQLSECGVVGESAIPGGRAPAAAAGAIESSGFADYGEVKWPRAGRVKGGHLQPDQVRRQEPR